MQEKLNKATYEGNQFFPKWNPPSCHARSMLCVATPSPLRRSAQSLNGEINGYASDLTQLILDISSYFAS